MLPVTDDLLKRYRIMAQVYEHEKLVHLPWFTRPRFIKDKNGIPALSDNPHYDPSTVYIPEKEYKAMSATMLQFWSYKKDNMDKILMFKLGRFYEMFFEDAIACNIVLGLRWMGDRIYKLHVGFPETNLHRHCARLIDHGFCVAVVDQTETSMMAEQRLGIDGANNRIRLKNGTVICKEKVVVERELTNIITRATLPQENQVDLPTETRWVLSIREEATTIEG